MEQMTLGQLNAWALEQIKGFDSSGLDSTQIDNAKSAFRLGLDDVARIAFQKALPNLGAKGIIYFAIRAYVGEERDAEWLWLIKRFLEPTIHPVRAQEYEPPCYYCGEPQYGEEAGQDGQFTPGTEEVECSGGTGSYLKCKLCDSNLGGIA